VVINTVNPHMVKKCASPGTVPLQELLLTGDFDDLGLADLAQPLPAARALCPERISFESQLKRRPAIEKKMTLSETNDDAS